MVLDPSRSRQPWLSRLARWKFALLRNASLRSASLRLANLAVDFHAHRDLDCSATAVVDLPILVEIVVPCRSRKTIRRSLGGVRDSKRLEQDGDNKSSLSWFHRSAPCNSKPRPIP